MADSTYIIGKQLEMKIDSIPPIGCFKVTNIYVDKSGKLKIEYDNTPTTIEN